MTGSVWRVGPAALLLLLAAHPGKAADCPLAAPAPQNLEVAFETPKGGTPKAGNPLKAPRAGDRFSVTLPVDKGKPILAASACLDDTPATIQDAADDSKASTGIFLVSVPEVGGAKLGDPLPAGDHRLVVAWTYGDGKDPKSASGWSAVMLKPSLNAVAVQRVSKSDRSFTVLLTGDGFDRAHKANNLIVIGGRLRDVCWTGNNECTSSTVIRGDVSGPRKIVLENVDPGEESWAPFKVCRLEQSRERCSEEKSDEEVSTSHWKIILLALVVLGVMVVAVFVLVLLGKKVFVIWGERYVLSVLLLDKETNTYSLSKVQFYVWTAVAVFGYAYLVLSRFLIQHWIELPAIPSGLPGIVGIAAGTAVGAQVVTQANGPKGAGALHPNLSDLITTGDVVAAERVQYLVWTLVGAAGFFLTVASLDPRTIVDLPDVPSSILALSGLSAFGYLGGKLARNPGPVINEITVPTGPDPEVVPPVTSQPSAAAAAMPGWVTTVQSAVKALTDAQTRFNAVVQTAGVAPVYAPAKIAVDAGAAALTKAGLLGPSSTAADIAAAKTAVDKAVTDSAKGAADAATALTGMAPANAAAADVTAATGLSKIAQDMAAALQKVQAALVSAAPPSSTTASAVQFGLMELRGRMLSQDATFKISRGVESGGDDFQLTFDRLEPSPKDPQHLQKPRVLERDSSSSDATLAKRLLLVVRLDDTTKTFFVPGSTHSLTVTNPDSQKVLFKYDVPETQKPS